MRSGYQLILLLVIGLLFAQSAQGNFSPRFSHLDIEDGLSMNTVNDLATDQFGYLWVATQTGLNRYDGNNFVIYQENGTTSGTSGDDISHLHVAKDGSLWLSTVSDGLNRFDHHTQTFQHFSKLPTGLPKYNITDLAEDGDGNIWVATQDKGVFVFSPTQARVIRRYTEQDLGTKSVTQLHLQGQTLWLASPKGVFYYSAADGLQAFSPLLENIKAITHTDVTSLWFAGDNSLWKLEGENLQDYSKRLPPRPAGSALTAISADIYGNLWLNFRNLGLVQLQEDNAWTHKPNAADRGSLSSSTLSALLHDNAGQLWVGTHGSGLNKLNLAALDWLHIRPGALPNRDITALNTRAIYRDHRGQLWVGTSQGLYQAREQNNRLVDLYSFTEPWVGLGSSFIAFIDQDANQNIWIGTRGNGLLLLDSNYQLLKHFRHDPLAPGSLPSDRLYQFYLDNNQQVWITTHGSGIARFNNLESGFTVIKDEFGSNETSDMLQDSQGNYWITSYGGGLTRLTPEGEYTHYSPETKPGIPSKHLMSIEVIDDTLWLASTDGIIAFNTQTETSKVYSQQTGLPNDSAYLLHKDQADRLWVGTAAGLTLIFADTGVIRNFSVDDGIQGNEYNFGASFEDRDGTLYLGGTQGFNQILSTQNLSAPKPRAPVIDQIRLMNDTRKFTPKVMQDSGQQGINVSHKVNLFALFFHSPSLTQGDTLRYQYRIIGFNNTWFDAHNNEVTFTGLPPGEYQLQLRALDLSHQASDITKLNVKIAPPPWESWWAYSLYIAVGLGLFSLIFYVWQQKFMVQQQLLLQLSRSEQRLNLALWSSGDEFWDWELKSGKVIRSNTFLKYPGKEMNLQETVMSTVHPDDQEKVMQAVKACLKGKVETLHITYRGRAQDNDEWQWVECRGKVTERNDNNRVDRVTGTIKNIQALKDTEGALRMLNVELEDRVELRTRELKSSQKNLESMIEELQLTREELKDKEKMATLGGLVASITHEVGTPIGVCVTASSNLLDRIREFNQMYQCNEVSEGDFAQYQEDLEESCRLFLTNMNRVSKLMNSFKHVAVDQSHDEVTQFNFKSYLMEIQQSLEPMLKRTQHHYSISCPDDLWLKTNPGVFYQIVSNLFNNSIMHAFEASQSGNMVLTVTQGHDGICLCYEDDGCGMSSEVKEQVFCPFFTTKRGKGGSGLGMNIVFNLVTQILEGELQVDSSPGDGTRVTIHLPHSLQVEQPRKEA